MCSFWLHAAFDHLNAPALRKKRAKTALLESNFENRLSFVEESQRELSYRQPDGVWGGGDNKK